MQANEGHISGEARGRSPLDLGPPGVEPFEHADGKETRFVLSVCWQRNRTLYSFALHLFLNVRCNRKGEEAHGSGKPTRREHSPAAGAGIGTTTSRPNATRAGRRQKTPKSPTRNNNTAKRKERERQGARDPAATPRPKEETAGPLHTDAGPQAQGSTPPRPDRGDAPARAHQKQ